MLQYVDSIPRASNVSAPAPDVVDSQGDCEGDDESCLTESLSNEVCVPSSGEEVFLCFWWWWIPVDAKNFFLTCVPLVLIFNLR